MKRLLLFTLISIVAAVDYYKMRDNYDVDTIMANKEDVKFYVDCYLDKGTCTDEAKIVKATIKDSIQHGCARCTDNLKYLYWRFLKDLKEIYPEMYVEYRQHFDPENKYIDAFYKEVSKYKRPTK